MLATPIRIQDFSSRCREDFLCLVSWAVINTTVFVLNVYSMSGCICVYFVYGYVLGLQAILVSTLRGEQSEIKLTADQITWIPSSLMLAQVPAQFTAGIIADKLGRKSVAIMSMFPGFITCVMTYFAQNFITLIIAFVIAGWVMMGLIISPVIIAESVTPKYRGSMLAIKNVFCMIGVAFTHILGPRCYWRTLAIYGAIPSVLGAVLVMTMPESPAWLAKMGKYKEAKKSFEWYRGDGDKEEFKQLIRAQEKVRVKKHAKDNTNYGKFYDYIFDKVFLKSLLICIVMFLYIEVSGKRIFVTYVSDIVKGIMKSNVSQTSYSIAFDAIDIIANLLAGYAMSRVRRRTLIFATGVPGVCICLLFCLVQYLLYKDILPQSLSWLSMTLYLLYFIPISFGVTPTITVLGGEILPLSHRGVGQSIASLVFSGVAFLYTKFTLVLFVSIGIHGTYFLNSILSIIFIVCIYFITPETNLKTLVQVENEIGGVKDDDVEDDIEKPMLELFDDKVVNKVLL